MDRLKYLLDNIDTITYEEVIHDPILRDYFIQIINEFKDEIIEEITQQKAEAAE